MKTFTIDNDFLNDDESLEIIKKALFETLKEVKTWDDYEELINANCKLLIARKLINVEQLLGKNKGGKKS